MFSVELKLNIANLCVFFLMKNDVLVRLGIQPND